jgi:hypothetical protein
MGGGKGLDWCMIKAGVRHTRMPDPAHVLSARGGQGGRNEKQIITGRDALLKMSNRIILFSPADTVGPSVRKTNKRFFHSFNIVSLVHTTAVATFTATTIL